MKNHYLEFDGFTYLEAVAKQEGQAQEQQLLSADFRYVGKKIPRGYGCLIVSGKAPYTQDFHF
ncbi:MAG: hypothetical protein N3B16_05920 [Candidatus Aminicenantes bacterium]|nr:hypothetical protein [Candidatus Aminicenantes bacterium]